MPTLRCNRGIDSLSVISVTVVVLLVLVGIAVLVVLVILPRFVFSPTSELVEPKSDPEAPVVNMDDIAKSEIGAGVIPATGIASLPETGLPEMGMEMGAPRGCC